METSEETPQLFPTDLELELAFFKKLGLGGGFPNRIRGTQPAIAARSLGNSETVPVPTLALPHNESPKLSNLITKNPARLTSRSADSQSVKVPVTTSEGTPQLFPTDLELRLAFFKKLGLGGGFPNRIRDSQPDIAVRSLETSDPKLVPTCQGPAGPKGFAVSQTQATQAIESFCSNADDWHTRIMPALWWRPKSKFISGRNALVVANLGKFDVVNGGESRIFLGVYFNPLGCPTLDAFEFAPGTDQEAKEHCTYRFGTILNGCNSETPMSNKTGGTLQDGCRVYRMNLVENHVNSSVTGAFAALGPILHPLLPNSSAFQCNPS